MVSPANRGDTVELVAETLQGIIRLAAECKYVEGPYPLALLATPLQACVQALRYELKAGEK